MLGCASPRQTSSLIPEMELSSKSFAEAKKSIADRDSLLALCREYADRVRDIDLLRDVQDCWMDLDKDAARAYFANLYRQNPDSVCCIYLHGRILSDRIERIEIGRRAIDLAPDWGYGYRLVLYSYYTHLFLERGDPETTAALQVLFERDEDLFLDFDRIAEDRWFNGKMLFYYYLYKDDLRSAEVELERAHEWEWKWVDEAELYLRNRSD
ncbi:hypothetical protein ACFLQV_04120 [Calditrichota bacterium]